MQPIVHVLRGDWGAIQICTHPAFKNYENKQLLGLFVHSFFNGLLDTWSVSLMKPQSCRTNVIVAFIQTAYEWNILSIKKLNRGSVLLKHMCITQVVWRVYKKPPLWLQDTGYSKYFLQVPASQLPVAMSWGDMSLSLQHPLYSMIY